MTDLQSTNITLVHSHKSVMTSICDAHKYITLTHKNLIKPQKLIIIALPKSLKVFLIHRKNVTGTRSFSYSGSRYCGMCGNIFEYFWIILRYISKHSQIFVTPSEICVTSSTRCKQNQTRPNVFCFSKLSRYVLVHSYIMGKNYFSTFN